jgi:hypothetical protein
MRLYYQGTLDYACGLYAVINALACTHGLDLNNARDIFQESLRSLPKNPALWQAFLRNETDHYWLIRRTLSIWCCAPPWKYSIEQPFGEALLPGLDQGADLGRMNCYLPEHDPPRGPLTTDGATKEAVAVWDELQGWFANQADTWRDRPEYIALLRFHRFLPGLEHPVVSHWTTVCRMQDEVLILHDASSEAEAVRTIARADCLPKTLSPALIRIVPESVLFLKAEYH